MSNNKTVKLKLVTPEGIFFESEKIDLVSLDTKAGYISVGHDHVPLVSVVKAGEILIKMNDAEEKEKKSLKVEGGVLEIREDSEIFILTEKAEWKD